MSSPKSEANVEILEDQQSHDPDMYHRDPPATNWKRFLPEYFVSNSEHARFLRKLDILVLGYCMLISFVQTLDTYNISNAYVSGMQEDLKLYGNQLSLFSTFYDIGIIIGAVPLALLGTMIRPSLLLPTCSVLWTIFVMCMAAAKNYQTIYALRFLVGLVEACAFPGFSALVGAWYTPEELGKRMTYYEISGNVASMFSGYIQSGLYAHMNGVRGLPAWKWLFIFDGLISTPIVIWGYLSIPDLPATTRSIFLNDADRRYAVRRMELSGRRPVRKLSWKLVKHALSTWHSYAFVLCYYLYGTFSWGDSYFNLWLQYLGKYSVEQINNIPTASQGAAIVNSFISSTLSDHFRHRPIFIAINMLICLMGNAFVANWHAPEGLKFLGYMMITTAWPAQSLTIAWANEVCQGNPLIRVMIVAVGNTFVYATNAWLQVVLFPSSKAPHYKCGYQVCAAFLGFAIVSVYICWWLLQRDYRRGTAVKSEQGLPEYPAWDSYFGNLDAEELREAELREAELREVERSEEPSEDDQSEEKKVTTEL